MANFNWNGCYVSGSTACAVVKYHGPTNSRGSRWAATITRGADCKWRASVTFADGPIAAAMAAAAKGGVDWQPTSCHSIDPDTYAIGF